jgi:hypothetical protein
MNCARFIIVAVALGLVACSGDDTPPARDQFPIVNARVYELQVAVAERNRAGIDSLLAAEILDLGENSDSLLNYVYGPGQGRPFSRFDIRGIVQTHRIARVDCSLIDTAGAVMEPTISFTFQMYDDSLWLLKRFDPIPDDVMSRPDTLVDSL